jgi:hypothetical protein
MGWIQIKFLKREWRSFRTYADRQSQTGFIELQYFIMALIVFADAPPNEGSGVLLHYQHEPLTIDGWETVDARDIIARHEDNWFAEIEAWHRKLSEQAASLTRWWGLLPGSRLILWSTTTPFALKPILYARAIIDLLRCHNKYTFWIIGAPNDMREYLSEWASGSESICIQERFSSRSNDLRNRANLGILIAWVNLFKQIVRLMIYVVFRKRRTIKPAKVLINSFVLNPALLEKPGDHFFGRMFDSILEISYDNVAWLYNDIVLDKSEARAKLKQLKRTAYFVSDLFRVQDLWFALRTTLEINRSLKVLRSNLPTLLIEGIPIPAFSKRFCFYLIDGVFPFLELIYYRLFLRAFDQSGAEVVIYPYEEKPMERAMLLAARDGVSGIKTVGFAHAAYSKGHLYVRRANQGEPPRPSLIAVTGEIAKLNFIAVGVPINKIITIGSPRYYEAQRWCGTKQNRRKKILMLVGFGNELKNLASMIGTLPSLFDSFDLNVRRYPYAWNDEQDSAEKLMKKHGARYLVDKRDLFIQIDESDIVLFESTSAAIEAVLRGRVVVQVKLADAVTTNHYFGCGVQEVIEFCETAEDLKVMLDRFLYISTSEYRKYAERQRSFIKALYSPVNPQALKNLLNMRVLDDEAKWTGRTYEGK